MNEDLQSNRLLKVPEQVRSRKSDNAPKIPISRIKDKKRTLEHIKSIGSQSS